MSRGHFVDADATKEGRPATRVNWLIRQLKNAPESLRVEASAMHARGPGNAELLKVVRDNPDGRRLPVRRSGVPSTVDCGP